MEIEPLFECSVTALVLADGLEAGASDVLHFLHRPAEFGRALLAVLMIPPVAAVLVAEALHLSPVAKVGVILMALAPIPSVMPKATLMLGARKAYVYGIYATFSALAVLTVPVTVAALDRLYGAEVVVPMPELLKLVLASVLAPLAIGMLVRALRPKLAERIAPWASRLSLILLAAAVAVILWRNAAVIAAMLGNGIGFGIAMISIAGLLGGRLLGGPDPRDRAALATTAAARHPAIAMTIAHANITDKRVDAAIMIYLVVSTVIVVLYLTALRRGLRARSDVGAT